MAKARIINIHWPLVFVITAVLYALIIITLPFNQTSSTVFLFALIAYWSRLPGVGMPSPFFILYQADIVDMLSLIVAVNIGGMHGVVFTIFCNITSRLAGVFPKWPGVINDALSQAVMCLFMPFVYHWIGDIFVCMMLYTIIRRLGFIVGYIVYPMWSLPQFLMIWTGATAVSLIINGFYAKYFGYFFNGILEGGVKFNWTLFLVATILIFFCWRMMVGKRSSKLIQQGALLRLFFRKIEGEKKEEKKVVAMQNSDEDILAEARRII